MNSITRGDVAFAVLCVVVMVAIFIVIALVLFVRRVLSNASERQALRGNPEKISQRLANIPRK
ncbi:MAG: hypothetical protein WAL85_12925 [Candidatus Korobacteraceae bacterium]